MSHVDTVLRAIATVVPGVNGVGADTPLAGPGAPLDSVGFVTLLVTLESELGHRVDLSESFLTHGATGPDTPFRTVGTLASHIDRQLAGAS